MSNDTVDGSKVTLLRDALVEAQFAVRAYDTKAQIVGVGYIFALGVVGQIGQLNPTGPSGSYIQILLAWGVIVIPIILFGHVLHPTRKSTPHITINSEIEPKHLLFVEPAYTHTVKKLEENFCSCDLVTEYLYELLKTSNLREIKRTRFLRGLYTAAFAFLFMFVVQSYAFISFK